MTIEAYLAYVIACIVVAVVPGPNVTVIIANSLRKGIRAGLASVAGAQAGLFIVLIVLVAGLHVIVEQMAGIFDWIRLAGAAYLAWLGSKLLLSKGDVAKTDVGGTGNGSYFLQGFLVLLSNPKVLLFFGAFIPQFINPAQDTFWQVVLLGGTFMLVTTTLDSGYAITASKAGEWLSRSRIRVVERISGMCMIAGGVWLALSRR